MPADSLNTGTAAPPPPSRPALFGAAARLLAGAAAPERHHLQRGAAFLLMAAVLEALGPLAGKFLIDNYLLPRNLQLPPMAGLPALKVPDRLTCRANTMPPADR